MIFFFGSSRSWAAREARRKARLMAKKRRRSIIQATVVIFSLVVFSISMWSLRRMRHSALSIRHNTHRSNGTHGLGRKLTGTVKTAVSALDNKGEMPKPPLEPELPVVKMDNSSYRTDVKEQASREQGDVSVKSQTRVSAESRSTSKRRSFDDKSSKESSNDHDGASGRAYRTREEERETNSNPAVRGMTQEDTISAHHETSMVHNDRASDMSHDGEVGKMEGIDMLDSEEGGEGLNITMPKKKSARNDMRQKRDSVRESENFVDARHVDGGGRGRDQTGEQSFVDGNKRMSMRDNDHEEKYGKEGYTRGIDKAFEPPAAREYRYPRRESEGSMQGEQGFGGVYRQAVTSGSDSSGSRHASEMQRDSGEHRVVTKSVDVSSNTRLRDGASGVVM